MLHKISFLEEIDKINDAFPAVLHCAECGCLRTMKIERGTGKLVHQCTVCGTARHRRSSQRGRDNEHTPKGN
jgi:hypothetical protein